MENSPNEDIKMLKDILSQGNDYIMELEAHLYNHQTFSESCLLLSSKVQSAFATAIAMTKLMDQRSLRPPRSATNSPRSQGSGGSFKEQDRREMFKKRKTLPSWSGQVQACSGTAMGMLVDDGYSWRKYGQKDILGAKFPRSYFRCTHRHSHGCYARKQVQRSENDTSMFCITYRGVHTCNNGFQKTFSSTNEQNIHQNQSFKLKTEAEFPSLKDSRPESPPSFSFPSTPASCLKPENIVFSSASNPENCENLDWEIADIISASTSAEQFVFGSDFSFDFY